MLSRTADHLFWMARYMERAENAARVLDVTHRMALLPDDSEGAETHLWYAPLNIIGCAEAYLQRHFLVEKKAVTRFVSVDTNNSSSIYTSLTAARENARAVRGAITSEMWESINATWLELNRLVTTPDETCETCFFDWVKERSHLFRGVTLGTMLKDDALSFIRLGTFCERADNTARILDVKYHLLLPEGQPVLQLVDYYQWGALLKSVSGFEAYRKVYRDVITPTKVAELLILRADMPRSLHACLNEIALELSNIDGSAQRESHRRAGALHAMLHYDRVQDIFARGSHGYLLDFLEKHDRLGEAVRQDYLARRDVLVVDMAPLHVADLRESSHGQTESVQLQ